MTKICTRCKGDLDISKFSVKGKYKNGNIKYQCECKACTKIYKDKHYDSNKDYYKDKAKKYRKEFYQWFLGIKKELKCTQCGEDRYWVLDFHHRDKKEKDYNIARLVIACSKKKLLKELSKCDVVCSNCHRDLHYKENNAPFF